MRQQLQRFGLLSTVLSFALISSSTVLALPAQATAHAQPNSPAPTSTAQPAGAGASTGSQAAAGQASTGKPANAGSQGATRLAAAQLKSCQKRETAITNIMSRLSDRGQKQLTLFTTIAHRTETFYTTKGKTLSNYDALVADVTAKKAVAQTAVDNVKSTSTTFTCGANDPKGIASSFKDSLKTEISALNDYKTSVKNLIVGVKSVQSTTASSSASTSTTSTTTTTTTDNKKTGSN